MYKGDYDRINIILKEELDRKKIESENKDENGAEIILYRADFEIANSFNKDVREGRVLETLYKNGGYSHDITYDNFDNVNVKYSDRALNSLENIHSIFFDRYDFLKDFICAEGFVSKEIDEIPTELCLITELEGEYKQEILNDGYLKMWAECYNVEEKKSSEKVSHDKAIKEINEEKNSERFLTSPSMSEKEIESTYTDEAIERRYKEEQEYDKFLNSYKQIEVTFYANVDKANIEEVTRGFQKSGSDIIAENFPELENIGNFNIGILNDSVNEKEIEISFLADVDVNEVNIEEVIQGFQKSGADIIAENFPELSNIGYFKILKEDATLNDFKEEKNTKQDEGIKEIPKESRILTSPPPPLVDGVAIRIDGLDDVTEREAKNYINLVVEKIQENARKNLSSISITKQEDGHIKLDYVLHNEKFERIRRITGYLVGSMDKWNNAKRAEEAERVKHVEKKTFEQGFSDLCKEHNVSPKKAIKAMVSKMVDDKQNGAQR